MVDIDKNQAFIKEFQARFEKKMKENEISILEYWKSQLDKVLSMKPEGVSSLQMQLKKISDMMEKRISIVKREQHD